jgi:hypothetical protein
MPSRTNGTPRFHRTEILYARIDEELMATIRQLADINERSIATTVQIILRKGLGKETQPLFIWVEEE